MKLEVNWLWQNYSDRPEQVFLQCDRQVWTYADTYAEVSRICHVLRELGIANGTRVGILLNNLPMTIFIYLALKNLGAIAVCLNTRLSDQETAQLLIDSQVLFMISDRHLLLPNSSTLIPLAEIETSGYPQCTLPLPFDPSQIQGIFFTSGTTGKPKAVPLSYLNHWHSAIAVHQFLELTNCHWLLCLPLYHVGGLAILWRTLILGGKITLIAKFIPETVITTVAETDVNFISLVPTMLRRILQSFIFPQNLRQWQNLRGIFLGGASADPTMLYQCLQMQLPIIITYGMTETASQIAVLQLLKYPDKLISAGQILPHIKLQIIKTSADSYGEIGIKSLALMSGYLGQNHTEFCEDDYFLTGDLGYLDADNFLYVVNRRTDVIISGGENIYPAEIEQVLQQHPLIAEVCVVAKADPEWGEVPAVIVTNSQISLEQMQDFCLSHHLSRYKLPKFLLCLPEIPRTPMGKYNRSLLKKLLAHNQPTGG